MHGLCHLFCSVPEAELRAQASGNLELAAQLTRTCVEGYLQSPTGLGPETMRFNQRKGVKFMTAKGCIAICICA